MASGSEASFRLSPMDPWTDRIGPNPVFRDALDARRSAWRMTPDAMYPDGYLGTVQSRRHDRVLQSVQRNTRRPYGRGVHKGERIETKDYFWPAEFNDMSGLEAQAEGRRFVSVAMLMNLSQQGVQLVNDGKPMPDPDRVPNLRALAPAWSGGGGQIQMPLGPRYY